MEKWVRGGEGGLRAGKGQMAVASRTDAVPYAPFHFMSMTSSYRKMSLALRLLSRAGREGQRQRRG